MTKKSEIDLELYLKKLGSDGLDIQKAADYLEKLISSNASTQLPKVR